MTDTPPNLCSCENHVEQLYAQIERMQRQINELQCKIRQGIPSMDDFPCECIVVPTQIE